MSPYEQVCYRYQLPFALYPFQVDVVNQGAPLARVGLYMEVGTGKTPTSTVIALHRSITQGMRWICIMPPILLQAWSRWLDSIPGVTHCVYAGTPKQRQKIDLDKQFILMSMQVFKNDWDYLYDVFEHWQVGGLIDEATSIKNVGSKNHHAVKDFFAGRDLQLLTATPLSTPMDAFAYVRLIAPGTYRNIKQFERIHIKENDIFNKVKEWDNLDLLHQNMAKNSFRVLKREVLTQLPKVTYVPLPYDLEGPHAKLYKELMNKQLLELEDGGKIDATTPQRLYAASQQICWNPDTFTGRPDFTATGFQWLEFLISELDLARPRPDKKLLVFATFKMTIRGIAEYLQEFGAVTVYGLNTAKQNQANLDRFLNDPACRVAIVQPRSGGAGLNLQHVCSDVFWAELPTVPADFTQGVGRVDRDGQPNPVTVYMPVANGTIQASIHDALMDKDSINNRVVRSVQDLRDLIYGVKREYEKRAA